MKVKIKSSYGGNYFVNLNKESINVPDNFYCIYNSKKYICIRCSFEYGGGHGERRSTGYLYKFINLKTMKEEEIDDFVSIDKNIIIKDREKSIPHNNDNEICFYVGDRDPYKRIKDSDEYFSLKKR